MSSNDVVFLQPVTSKNDVTLCKLDVNVRTEWQSLVALVSLNLSRNSIKENVLLSSKFYVENQMW